MATAKHAPAVRPPRRRLGFWRKLVLILLVAMAALFAPWIFPTLIVGIAKGLHSLFVILISLLASPWRN